jgi:hypothetical protein
LMMRQARGPGFVVPILSCQNESRWNDLSNSGPWIFWSRIIVKWCQVIWCIYIYHHHHPIWEYPCLTRTNVTRLCLVDYLWQPVTAMCEGDAW